MGQFLWSWNWQWGGISPFRSNLHIFTAVLSSPPPVVHPIERRVILPKSSGSKHIRCECGVQSIRSAVDEYPKQSVTPNEVGSHPPPTHHRHCRRHNHLSDMPIRHSASESAINDRNEMLIYNCSTMSSRRKRFPLLAHTSCMSYFFLFHQSSTINRTFIHICRTST